MMKAGRVEQAAEQKSACTSTGAAPVGKRGLGVAAWERALPAKPPTAAKLPLQAKLTVNEPGDAYEQEADRVAEQVMRMPEQRVQRAQCACGGKAGPDGECEACKAKRLGLQMKVHPAGGGAAMREAPESVHQVISSPGQQLDAATRAFMEPRFGQNFDGVRVHTGPEAAASAAAVGARAYAVGRDVVFGAGEYAPQSGAGQRLLAHELAHTLQQGGIRRASTEQSDGVVSLQYTDSAMRVSRQPSLCHPTNRWPGNVEHSMIEDEYVTRINPGGGAMEYAIPQSGPNGGTGYADIVDLILHKVYEIKTYVGAAGGVIEAQRYADMAQVHCAPPIPQNPWSVGNDYPAHTIPFGATDELVVQQYPAYPGVIVYYKRRRRRVPDPVPVPSPQTQQEEEEKRQRNPQPQPLPIPQPASIPQPVLVRIREFLRQVVESGENAEDAARRFLQQNPELVYLVAGVAIAIFVATIAEDILTAGAGIADDPATIGAAYALWRIAMQMQQAH